MKLFHVVVLRVAESSGLVAAETLKDAQALALADAKTGTWDFDPDNLEASDTEELREPQLFSDRTPVVVAVGEALMLSRWLARQSKEGS